MSEATTAEIRAALEVMRKFMAPGLYDQLNAQLCARENDWPLTHPVYPPEDEALEAPDVA